MKTDNREDFHPDQVQLLLALDGELEPGEIASIATHVESCSVCRGRWEQWKRLSERIVEYHEGALQAQIPQMSPLFARAETRSRRSPARVVAAFSSVAAAVVFLVWLVTRADRPAPVPMAPGASAEVAAATLPATPQPQAVHRRRVPRRRVGMAAEDNGGFVALPFSDAALPLRDATVVRVELPIEELWLSGLAVEGGYRETMVQADVLLGIDGLPRGIRVVQ